MKLKPRQVFLVFLLSFLLTIPGCTSPYLRTGGVNQDMPQQGGTLTVALESQTDVLDPHYAVGWVSYRVLNQIYEGLVSKNVEDENSADTIKPALAKSWEVSDEGKTFTFHLRAGVKFHDGTPLDAEAVKYNFERMYDQKAPQFNKKAALQTAYIWKDLKRVEVIDPLTIRFCFNSAFYDFPDALAFTGMGSTEIISAAALKKWGNAIGQHPVGTGPFQFLSRDEDKIVLVKNQNYWGSQAHLDRVVFLEMPDPYARVNALQTGMADVIFVPPTECIKNLENEGLLLTGTTAHIWFLILNNREHVFQDIRVRQAIAMAIDKDKIVSQMQDIATPANESIYPQNASYVQYNQGVPYDPQRARKLLREAGYPSGFDTVMQTSFSGSGQILPVKMAEKIQYDLHKVGINVNVKTYEWIKYLHMWNKGMSSGVGMGQIWGYAKMDYLWQMFARSDAFAPRGYNSNYYHNSAVDDILTRVSREPSGDKRAALYRQANQMIINDCWNIPIVIEVVPVAMKPEVKGLKQTSAEWYDFKTIWVNGRE